MPSLESIMNLLNGSHGAAIFAGLRQAFLVCLALAVAGCSIPGQTVVRTAESATITFPTFMDCMRQIGADIQTSE